MGLYDSFWIKAKCPYCGNEEVFEFQVKELGENMIDWRQGNRFGKFKKELRKECWIPDIKEGIIHNGLTGCNSKKCEAWGTRKRGYNSGFGRQFEVDIVIKSGKVYGVKNIRKIRN